MTTHPHDHQLCVDEAIQSATRLCQERGSRLTDLRKQVLQLVWSSHKPIGAYEILKNLQKQGRSGAPPTVYRALDFLLELGVVHRISSMNAYVGCTEPGRPHISQFFLCTACGIAAELNNQSVNNSIEITAKEMGFKIQDHTIEVSGLCSACQ